MQVQMGSGNSVFSQCHGNMSSVMLCAGVCPRWYNNCCILLECCERANVSATEVNFACVLLFRAETY